VTLPAADLTVLPGQGHFGGIVIEFVDLFIQVPSFCAMTGIAAGLKPGTMRGLCLPERKDQE